MIGVTDCMTSSAWTAMTSDLDLCSEDERPSATRRRLVKVARRVLSDFPASRQTRLLSKLPAGRV